MVEKEKQYGQIFTPEIVVKFMVSLSSIKEKQLICEPSAGEGVFLEILSQLGYHNIDAFEIDNTLDNKSKIEMKYTDFLKLELQNHYDLVIGNPPYVRWKNMPKDFQQYLTENEIWKERLNSLADLLYPFIYSSVDALKENGELIFITPGFWLKTLHASKLRRFLTENGTITHIINFNEMRIFDNVSSSIIIFKFIKSIKKQNMPILVVNVNSKKRLTATHLEEISVILNKLSSRNPYLNEDIYEAYLHHQFHNGQPWNIIPPQYEAIISVLKQTKHIYSPKVKCTLNGKTDYYSLAKLFTKDDLEELDIPKNICSEINFTGTKYYTLSNPTLKINEDFNLERNIRLGDIAEIGNGLVSGLDRAFQLSDLNTLNKTEKSYIINVIKAYDLKQYWATGYTPYIFLNNLHSERELKEKMPHVYNQLLKHKEKLNARYSYNRNIPWWQWVFLRNWELFHTNDSKIFCPCKERIDKRNYARFSYIQGQFYPTQDVTGIVLKQWVKEDIRFILAQLNSNTILTWLKYQGLARGGVLEFSEKPLSKIPIRLIDWSNDNEVAIHNKIVKIVDHIIKTQSSKGKEDIDKILDSMIY